MAKRFTDTNKWDHSWFRKLSPKMKCAWFYLLDKCDGAGVWTADFEAMSFHIGETIVPADFIAFAEKLKEIGPDKYWIRGFVDFQYGKLSEDCKPHKPVIDRLKKLNLLEPFQKAFESLKEKEKEKETEKDQEKEPATASLKPLEAPGKKVDWVEEANLVIQTCKIFGYSLNDKVRGVLGPDRVELIKAAGGLLDLKTAPPNDFTVKGLAGRLKAAHELRAVQEGA